MRKGRQRLDGSKTGTKSFKVMRRIRGLVWLTIVGGIMIDIPNNPYYTIIYTEFKNIPYPLTFISFSAVND